MKEFIALNRQKFIFGLKLTSMVFTGIALALFGWGYFRGQIPTLQLFITVLIVAGVVLPIFTMSIGTLSDYLKYKRVNRILNSYPFGELLKFGFARVATNQKTKFMFSHIILRGYFNDYPMECEVDNNIFRVSALVNRNMFKQEHMDRLKRDLGSDRVTYDWIGIALEYNLNEERVTSFEQLKTDMDKLVRFFRREKLDPWDKPWD